VLIQLGTSAGVPGIKQDEFPFMLFVSLLDFLLANDMKFSVFVESARKLKLRITSAAAENRELLQH
jgi:hypothetical protein